MLIPVTCSSCRHEFKVDSSFLGTVRKCPECKTKFKVDQEAAESLGTDLDSLRGQKLTCSECLRSFIPSASVIDREIIPCRFCSHKFDFAEGLETYKAIRPLEKRIRQALLEGKSDNEVLSELKNLNQAWKAKLLAPELKNLPFTRKEVLDFGTGGLKFVRPRPYCDICNELAPDEVLEIKWRLTQYSRQSSGFLIALGLLVAFGGGRFRANSAITEHNSDKVGIYCVCQECHRPFRNWQWRRFFGMTVPSHDEFELFEVRSCVLNDGKKGTVCRYV